MKKLLMLVLVFSLAMSLMTNELDSRLEQRDISSQTGTGQINPSREPWDLLFQFDVNDPTGETGMTGIEWDSEYFYVSKWRISNQVFKFDPEGNYIEAVTVPVTGARDLAFDGVNMYGSAAASTVYCWNAQTGAAVPENNIYLPGHSVRGLAYDPITDTFWSGNWNDPIVNWDRDGNIINSFPSPGDIYLYGLAFDPEDEEGAFLYAFVQGETCMIVKIAVATWEIVESVDVTEYGGVGAIAGGLCFMNDWDPALSTLGALFQGAPDFVCVIELYNNASADTPGYPQIFTVTPEPMGELTAEITWINPSETASGETLTDLDEMRLYRDDELILTINEPAIGGTESWTDEVPLAGHYEYSVTGYNDAGEGLTASEWAYIGEDVPAAVSGFSIENVDGNAALAWINPTEGLHGYNYLGSIDGYHLLRSDGVMLELSGIMTEYLDTSLPIDYYYIYTIQPYNQVGDGGCASSDSCWISNDTAVIIGNPNTTLAHDQTPFDVVRKASLCEVLYYSDEIAAQIFASGALTSLNYSNLFSEAAEDMAVNIWVGETTLTSLSEGWIPANELNLVYSGTVDFPLGRNEIFIVLDEPYLYGGANLVIMTERLYSPDWSYDDPFFLYTEYPDLPVRCLKCHAMHANEIDPNNPPADHYSWNLAPNTILFFNTEDLGSLTGYARSAETGTSLENILIQIEDTNNYTYTAENGYYCFPELVAGIYQVQASGLGYFPELLNVEVLANEILQQDFNLQPVPQVEVTGCVVGSDYPDIGLAGAEVSLRGLGIHTGFTDDEGYFSIPTIYVNNTYQLYVILPGYEILIDEVVITTENIDLGELLLIEINFPVSNVIAWQNDEDTIMNLVWSSPNYDDNRFWDFEENDGGFEVTLTWEWGIDEIVGSHSGEKVWGTALNENTPGNSYGEIVTPEVRILSDDTILSFWHWYHMEENYDGGNVKISTDAGATWSVITPLGGYPENAISHSSNTMPDEPAYNGACTDWIPATFELGEFLGETARFKFQFGCDLTSNYEGWFIDDVYIGSAANNQRLIESYNISRLLFEDEQNQGNWETIATAYIDTSYIDLTWENAASDIYKYAIEAIYTGNISSAPAFSNYVARDYHTTASISVFDQNDNPVPDAWVQFYCEDEGPDDEPIIYERYTDALGEVYIPLLWRGYYDILIIPDNMELYQHGSIPIYTPYTLSVNLAEILNPVSGLDFSVIGNDVNLWWSAPANQDFLDFEADNGGFTGDDEWEWANGCNAGEAFSGENCWSLCPNENYPMNANISLYTPSFLIPTEDTQLSFYHYYDIEMFDGCNLKISTNNGNSWNIIYPEGGYPDPSSSVWNVAIPQEPCWNRYSYGWVQEVFELGEYRGQEVIFRFHFGSDESASYAGWDIDDFRIGQPASGTRVMEYYNVYRDSSLLASNLMEPEYSDENLDDGTYNYGVSVVYSAGESAVTDVEVIVYPINISGFITLSDLAGNPPAEGVAVSLQNNYFFWETTTDANGEFCLENINGNRTYTIRAEYENYYTWSEELVVIDQNVNYDMITLIRVIYPTYDVVATVNEADTECYLNWNEPGSWQQYEILYDDGESETATCWYDATNERSVWFTSQEGPCMIIGGSINIYDGTWPYGNILSPFTAAVWEYNSSNGLPDAMLGSVEVIPENYNWVTFEFDNPILIQGTEFFLGYIQDTYLPDCIPVAVDESYPTVNRSFRHWITGGEPWLFAPYQDFMIRAIVAGPDGRQVTINYDNRTVGFNNNTNTGGTLSNHPSQKLSGRLEAGDASYRLISRNERDLVGYNIIRGEFEDEANWAFWESLNTEPVTDLTFTDTDWVNLELETNYAYGVITVYTNNNLTIPAFSNWIARDIFATLEISLITNTGDIPAGAEITLTATGQDPDGNYPEYTGIADENGECTIQWIRKGNYDLDAEFPGFAVLRDNFNIIDDEVAYAGMITEFLYPAYHVTAEENHYGNVDLSWHTPADFLNIFYDFDGNDGIFTGDPGWVWGSGSNAGEPWSGYNCWSTYPGEYYDNHANISLYTPFIEIHSQDTQLIFYHWYDIEEYWSGANVKVSTDGGLTWEVIEPLGGYPEDACSSTTEGVAGEPAFCGNSGGWVSSSFNLIEYYNQAIIIKFQMGTKGHIEPYLGWDIDDVFVGIPDNPGRSVTLYLEKFENRRDRTVWYHIFRGLADDQSNYEYWDLIAESLQDTIYEDITWLEITEPGDYMYCVRTEYTNGILSEPGFSNPISLILNVPVTIYVICNSGDPPVDAHVFLTGHDGVHNYDAVVSGGMVHWDEIRKGVYYLSILKDGYEPYQDIELWITEQTEMYVDLIESLYPPANVAVTDWGLVTWDVPNIRTPEAVSARSSSLNKSTCRDRHLSYYNIYMDGDLTGQTTELQYQLSGLVPGVIYLIGVSAYYSSNEESEIIEVYFPPSGNNNDLIPAITVLNNCFPNPFNPETCINFDLAEPGKVKIDIYNIKGQKIKTLINEWLAADSYNVSWNGTDAGNHRLASGIYFCRMQSAKYSSIKKMILLK